jgi:hypothetical protein
MDVGRTWRTPAKHDLMRSLIGKEVGVSKSMAAIRRCIWFDLTAGDAAPIEGQEWAASCSPGILANHARNVGKPTYVFLYEIKTHTYDRLLAALTAILPTMGYRQANHNVWLHGEHVYLCATNGSGAEAGVSMVQRGDAVFALNDPNAITEWAMRPTFASEIAGATPWFRSLSTLGCNPAGIKRLNLEERTGWFEHVRQQELACPRHRDLLLCAIERDSAQWAYLMSEPTKWRGYMEATANTAFKRHGAALSKSWWRQDSETYDALKRQLFFTAKEREAGV